MKDMEVGQIVLDNNGMLGICIKKYGSYYDLAFLDDQIVTSIKGKPTRLSLYQNSLKVLIKNKLYMLLFEESVINVASEEIYKVDSRIIKDDKDIKIVQLDNEIIQIYYKDDKLILLSSLTSNATPLSALLAF